MRKRMRDYGKSWGDGSRWLVLADRHSQGIRVDDAAGKQQWEDPECLYSTWQCMVSVKFIVRTWITIKASIYSGTSHIILAEAWSGRAYYHPQFYNWESGAKKYQGIYPKSHTGHN